jgi:hypothetical protein
MSILRIQTNCAKKKNENQYFFNHIAAPKILNITNQLIVSPKFNFPTGCGLKFASID